MNRTHMNPFRRVAHFWRRNRALTTSATLAIALLTAGEAAAEQATAVATFHSLGLYWTPKEGGSANRMAQVRFREAGGPWRDGLPMRYNPIAGTDNDLTEYRGSIVHLRPGTSYEVQLTLDETGETSTLLANTWSEDFPEGTVVPVGNRSTTLKITESGTASGYLVYDGKGATIDVGGAEKSNITIDASHVIVRNLTLRGATANAIRILGGHDIVIEDLDISEWGSLDWDGDYAQNLNAGVYSYASDLARLIIQRCRIHHPNHDANSWEEHNCYHHTQKPPCTNRHPAGAQAIVFNDTAGNHVIRFNELFSDIDHHFNDTMGGVSNATHEGGFPGHDSDIYGNYVADCWDDGIEAEGSNRNVRIWGNYIENCFMAIGNAATSIGPLYAWRNVSGQCRRDHKVDRGGALMKMTYAYDESWMTGHMYIFHNTILNVDDLGCNGLGNSNLGNSGLITHHAVSRNNILHVRSSSSLSISMNSANTDNDFDYDLHSATVPDGHEANGLSGVPDYASGLFNRIALTGDFSLKPTSPGFDKGVRLPNFNDHYRGDAPDMGAHEASTDRLHYGVAAANVPQPCEEEKCNNGLDDNCNGSIDEGCPSAGGNGGGGEAGTTGGASGGGGEAGTTGGASGGAGVAGIPGGVSGGAGSGASDTPSESGCRVGGPARGRFPSLAVVLGLGLLLTRRRQHTRTTRSPKSS